MTTEDLKELYDKAVMYTLRVRGFEPEAVEIELDGTICTWREDYYGGESERQEFYFSIEKLTTDRGLLWYRRFIIYIAQHMKIDFSKPLWRSLIMIPEVVIGTASLFFRSYYVYFGCAGLLIASVIFLILFDSKTYKRESKIRWQRDIDSFKDYQLKRFEDNKIEREHNKQLRLAKYLELQKEFGSMED